MPHEKVTIVYKFSELSPRAKEYARDKRREIQCDDEWWYESTFDEAIEQAALMGITIDRRHWTNPSGFKGSSPCIYFSGFSSQGDGACFEGTWYATDTKADRVADGWGDAPATTEIKRIAAVFGEIAKEYPEASFKVKHSGHYSHEHCTDFTISLGDAMDNLEGITEEKYSEVERDLIKNARDFMRWIYRQLNAEYDYRMSDEAIDEDIEANETEFTEDGRIA
jgi:hypothetical protein